MELWELALSVIWHAVAVTLDAVRTYRAKRKRRLAGNSLGPKPMLAIDPGSCVEAMQRQRVAWANQRSAWVAAMQSSPDGRHRVWPEGRAHYLGRLDLLGTRRRTA